MINHLVSYITTLFVLLSEPYVAFRCSSDGSATPSLEVALLMSVCRRQRGLQKEVVLHFVAPNIYNLKITILKITCQPKLDLHYMTLIKVSCHQVFTLVRRVSASCEINWATFRIVFPTWSFSLFIANIAGNVAPFLLDVKMVNCKLTSSPWKVLIMSSFPFFFILTFIQWEECYGLQVSH